MLDSVIQGDITLTSFILCTAVSVILGVLCALLCGYRSRSSQSCLVTIAMMPAVVQMVIMLVNGNIGTGVAVAGAFGLVRFRSAAGSAREIIFIFMAMALGIAAGMGYLTLAVLFFLIMAVVSMALCRLGFGAADENNRDLRITIPEDLDYEGVFDDIFNQYTRETRLESVKTSNLGTLYELRYTVTMKDSTVPKAFLDALRTRNGNLNIVCGRVQTKETL